MTTVKYWACVHDTISACSLFLKCSKNNQRMYQVSTLIFRVHQATRNAPSHQPRFRAHKCRVEQLDTHAPVQSSQVQAATCLFCIFALWSNKHRSPSITSKARRAGHKTIKLSSCQAYSIHKIRVLKEVCRNIQYWGRGLGQGSCKSSICICRVPALPRTGC